MQFPFQRTPLSRRPRPFNHPEKIECEKARLASAKKQIIELRITLPIKAHDFPIKHAVGGQ